jgi:hypothetical protein
MRYLFSLIFKLMKAKKILVYSQIVHIIVIIYIFKYKNNFEHCIGWASFKPTCCLLLRYTQILYSTHHKLNEGFDGFIFLLTKVFNHFLMFMSKNCKLDFGQMSFLFTLP